LQYTLFVIIEDMLDNYNHYQIPHLDLLGLNINGIF